MSTWNNGGRYYCPDYCGHGCNGHEVSLVINNTSDTFVYRRDKKLVFSGPLEELTALYGMISEGEDLLF